MGPDADDRAVGTLGSHAADIAHFIATQLPAAQPPVLVVHSYSGLIASKYIQLQAAEGRAEAQGDSGEAAAAAEGGGKGAQAFPRLAGLAFLDAMPCSGERQQGKPTH